MRIIKYTEFIKEELTNPSKNYIETALLQLKMKIDNIFKYEGSDEETEGSDNKSISSAKKDSNNKEKISFKDLGVNIVSSEVSKYSHEYSNLSVKFIDDQNEYSLIISINIKEGKVKTDKKPMVCDVKLKKYDLDTFDIVAQIPSPIDGDSPDYLQIEIDKIDEDYLVDLKIKLDERSSDKDEFKIET